MGLNRVKLQCLATTVGTGDTVAKWGIMPTQLCLRFYFSFLFVFPLPHPRECSPQPWDNYYNKGINAVTGKGGATVQWGMWIEGMHPSIIFLAPLQLPALSNPSKQPRLAHSFGYIFPLVCLLTLL